MNCCKNCFNENYLINKIQNYNTNGSCDYCGSENVKIIPIAELTEEFDKLMDLYGVTTHGEHFHYEIHCPSDFGESLEYLIQDDWNIFSDSTNQNDLLFDILNYHRSHEDMYDSTNLYSKHFKSISSYSITDIWRDFSYNIKTKNRFFPEINILEYLKELVSKKVTIYDMSKTLYRAREGVHEINEMGPPPNTFSTHGRANPKGIPYLYVATNELTCIAEIRPWVGAIISVATIKPNTELKLVDLSKKSVIESPFLAEDLVSTIEALDLINQLSYELSKPVSPNDSYLEYIPTQFLAEYIKELGYDGLIYKSSLGNEENIVIFDCEKTQITDVKKVKLNFVGYGYDYIK